MLAASLHLSQAALSITAEQLSSHRSSSVFICGEFFFSGGIHG